MSYYANATPLWDSYLATRSVAARNALVELYLPVVAAVVQKIARNLPQRADIDDLYSTGAIGVIAGVERFDPSRNVAA